MKKLIALLLAAIMMVGVLSVAYADDLEVLTEFGDLTIDDAEYDPNPDYDMWTVIEYYIEGADATVSRSSAMPRAMSPSTRPASWAMTPLTWSPTSPRMPFGPLCPKRAMSSNSAT